MKKSNSRLTRFAILLLALTMVALILVSGTYAKYISEATIASTARVAKWDIKINDETIVGATQTLDIDLWGTILDTVDDQTETDVDDSEKIIAPGTKGEFEITIENASEVNATYTLEGELTNTNNIPLEFSIDDGATWTTTFPSIDVDTATTIEMGDSETINVQWRWAFVGANSSNYTVSQTDATDTALGIAGTAEATLTVTVNAVQVD